MNYPNDPKNNDSAWEEAMSRDFDARVRDLHEAPLDISSVKGKAVKIKRNRRAAVAGGILGVAAIATPFALLVNNGGDAKTDQPPVVNDPSETIADPVATDPEYISGGEWHQADGKVVGLPNRDYSAAVLWDNQLVATYYDGEVFLTADVIDADGTVVDSFDTTGPVAVNEAGTTIAWIDTDGTVETNGPGGKLSVGTVDLAAAGEGVAFTASAVSGGPDCHEEVDGCIVYVESSLGEDVQAFSSHGTVDIVAPGVTKVFDATGDGVLSVRTRTTADLTACGGLFNTIDGTVTWETCDSQVWQISPDGAHAAAPPSQYDGLGPLWISVRDTATSEETGRYTEEGGFIGTWAWTSDGQLIFDTYDGARWHLYSMAPDGERTELVDPVKGDEFSPFTLIQR